MFNTITTCRLSHYFRLKTCSSFLSHSQVFHLMFVIKYVTVLSGKYPANFTRIPDSAGCLHFTGYRIVLSGSGTSLENMWTLSTVYSSLTGCLQDIVFQNAVFFKNDYKQNCRYSIYGCCWYRLPTCTHCVPIFSNVINNFNTNFKFLVEYVQIMQVFCWKQYCNVIFQYFFCKLFGANYNLLW